MDALKIINRLNEEICFSEFSFTYIQNPHKLIGRFSCLGGTYTVEINPSDSPKDVIDNIHKKIVCNERLIMHIMENQLDIGLTEEREDGFLNREILSCYDGNIYQLREGKKILIEKD